MTPPGVVPYQREVVVAGAGAGALALGAEAVRAQRQAGPPAPAQAEPAQGKQQLMGQLTGKGGGPVHCQAAGRKGLEHGPPPKPGGGTAPLPVPYGVPCPLSQGMEWGSLTWSQRCSRWISASPWRRWRGWLEALKWGELSVVGPWCTGKHSAHVPRPLRGFRAWWVPAPRGSTGDGAAPVPHPWTYR